MNLSRKQGCLLALVGVPLLIWALYRLAYPSFSWTQKTSMVVETPSGEVRGSGNVYVRWSDGPAILPDPPHFNSIYKGEATVIDLGDGKYLFALIKGASRLALRVFNEKRLPDSTNALLPFARKVSRQKGEGPSEIPPKNYPLLVTFDDINDPASVKRVDPDNLDAAFGCPSLSNIGAAQASEASDSARTGAQTGERKTDQCYALKSITLEITDEPVTTGKVEEVLGWTASNKTIDEVWFSVGTAKRRLFQGLREPLRTHP